MALETFKGTFTAKAGTGSQTVSFSPPTTFTPKAIIMWTDAQTAAGDSADLQLSYGFSDGTTHKCVGETSEDGVGTSNCGRMNSNKVISIYSVTPALLSEADLTSFGSNQFILDWTTSDSTAYLIHYFAIGGADLTNVDCNHFIANTSVGDQAVTGVGFQPDCVLALATITGAPPNTTAGNASLGLGFAVGAETDSTLAGYSEDATATTETIQNQTTKFITLYGNKSGLPTVFAQGGLKSFDSDGFTVNWNVAPIGAYAICFLALKGGQYHLASENSPVSADPAAQSITGFGFQPRGALFTLINNIIEQGLTFGAASAAGVEGCVGAFDDDNVGTTQANTRSSTTKAMSTVDAVTPTTTLAECDLTSFDSDGLTLGWPTRPASALSYRVIAMGSDAPAAAGADRRRMIAQVI